MLLAAFSAVIAWATASSPDVGERSPTHPGWGAPEAREGWGAAERRDSLEEPRSAVADDRTLSSGVRDVAGNPTTMTQRVSGGTQQTWTYPATASYSEVPSRSRSGGVSETYGYDAQSRLTSWRTTYASAPATNVGRGFVYDGAGRLRQVTRTGPGATVETYRYDVDDGVPYETRAVGATTTHVFRHEGWRREGTSPTTLVDTEDVLPMASLRGGELVVKLLEPDGHALAVRGPVTQTQEVLGAFGLRLWKYQSGPDGWVVDGSALRGLRGLRGSVFGRPAPPGSSRAGSGT
jgi:hypothetical protein